MEIQKPFHGSIVPDEISFEQIEEHFSFKMIPDEGMISKETETSFVDKDIESTGPSQAEKIAEEIFNESGFDAYYDDNSMFEASLNTSDLNDYASYGGDIDVHSKYSLDKYLTLPPGSSFLSQNEVGNSSHVYRGGQLSSTFDIEQGYSPDPDSESKLTIFTDFSTPETENSTITDTDISNNTQSPVLFCNPKDLEVFSLKDNSIESSSTSNNFGTNSPDVFSTNEALSDLTMQGKNESLTPNSSALSKSHETDMKSSQVNAAAAAAAAATTTKSTKSKKRKATSKGSAGPAKKKVAHDLRHINYVIAPNSHEDLPACAPLSQFRIWNNITMNELAHLNESDETYIYRENKFVNSLYDPHVNKKRRTNKEMLKKQSAAHRLCHTHPKGKMPASEGNLALCPFCPLESPEIGADSRNVDSLFYTRNDSKYLHHMIQYHGVFSNGELVREPLDRKWAYNPETKSRDKIEVIQCPYCLDEFHRDVFISIKKYKDGNDGEHRMLKYLRHVKEFHDFRENAKRKKFFDDDDDDNSDDAQVVVNDESKESEELSSTL
ncbi:unnamed protein product [Ambrosiozyma monospora]|uniref:Unnamed protein product n=1 Tax=Ambrosiozyma monospora TaxID=43982 RepID=A0ACB5SUI6_AMBMO|nr:unnamed protein product [Ambrosiozyma monospora]